VEGAVGKLAIGERVAGHDEAKRLPCRRCSGRA
jgi:hypothetical protein